jgi:hypothetical protein
MSVRKKIPTDNKKKITFHEKVDRFSKNLFSY